MTTSRPLAEKADEKIALLTSEISRKDDDLREAALNLLLLILELVDKLEKANREIDKILSLLK